MFTHFKVPMPLFEVPTLSYSSQIVKQSHSIITLSCATEWLFCGFIFLGLGLSLRTHF